MNSRIASVKRNETIEPKPATTNDATERGRNREMVALVKNWIYEFQAPRHANIE